MRLQSDQLRGIPCAACAGGVMHYQKVTLFTWLVDEPVTMPDFPAWVCDLCGERLYDPKMLVRLSMILSPNAGRPLPEKVQPSLKSKKNNRKNHYRQWQ